MKVPGWTRRYLEIPYQAGGRDWEGADCFGIVRLVLAHEAGIVVPVYDWVDPKDPVARVAARREATIDSVWHPIRLSDARAFDIVMISGEHVGIMVSATHLLHSEESAGPCCEPVAGNRLIRPPLRRHYTLCR